MPGKNATGTNTAISTSAVAMTAPSTSRIASDAAWRAGFRYSWMCRSMFSITTIASSTTMPVARMMPKSVSVLIEKPSSLTNANAPISETGMVMRRDERAAPALQEQEDHQDDEDDGLDQRLQHFADGLVDDLRRVERDLVLQPGREALRQPLELGAHAASTSSALAVGSWMTPKPTASRPWNRSCEL